MVILLVEDNSQIRSDMKRMLRKLNLRVIEADDAGEALEHATHEHPDLVFTDLELPTLAMLTQRFGADAQLKDVPIVTVDYDYADRPRNDGIVVFECYEKFAEFLRRD